MAPPNVDQESGGGSATAAAPGNKENNPDVHDNDNVSSMMKLLDLRLKPSSAISMSIIGIFTSAANVKQQQEIATIKVNGTIDIYRIVVSTTTNNKEEDDEEEDEEEEDSTTTTSMKLMKRIETYSIIRCISKIRYPGDNYDMLAVTSDAGTISILDFTSVGQNCKIVHCVNFGKVSCRRDTPGQFVASDPMGRAVMVAAIEKRKLIYVLNRDSTGKPTIASPLQANRPRTITYDTVGIDNGHDNPIFATIELQYPDISDDNDTDEYGRGASSGSATIEKQVAYYELDLGLNHVSRKWATTTQRTACCLAAVPGGANGPGGVLVGSEDYIEYIHDSFNKAHADNDGNMNPFRNKLVCTIPRRKLHPPNKGVLITKITIHRQKKYKFFALAQTELGDVYKITIRFDTTNKSQVIGLSLALLDTLPAANSLNISSLGLLFCASEFDDHYLYQFVGGIDLPNSPTSTSEELVEAIIRHKQQATEENANKNNDATSFLTTATAIAVAPTFHPTVLKNLRKIYTLDNPSPTTGVMVGELAGNEVSPQIYTLTGRGPHSSMRVLRHGASVTELAVSDLPGIPGGIFTVPDNSAEVIAAGGPRNDKYIVVSFVDATLVLSVGESVEEVGKESGFSTNTPTLACSALGTDGALCQVHPSGVRHIQNGQAKQWHCPGLKRIECASANESQVIIALAGGEIIYFELDAISGNLTQSPNKEMSADVCSLDVGIVAKGRSRSMFAAVGCRDQTVRIVSLEPDSLLVQRSSTALKSRPHSVALQVASSVDAEGNTSGGDDMTLVIGLDDGSSLRASVDPVTGAIGTSPTRRFLGARPVAVSRITLESQPAALLLSSRPWIACRDSSSGKHVMAPLSFAPLDQGCSFRSDVVKEGIIATAGKTLRILSVDASGMGGGDDEAFNTTRSDLRYTPRQMTLMSANPGAGASDQRKSVLVVVESDCNEYGLEEKKSMGFDRTGEGTKSKSASKDDDDAMDMDEGSDDEGSEKGDKDKEGDEEDEDDDDDKEARKTPIRGPVPPVAGHWGSCVRLLDPTNNCSTLDCIEMGRNEAALCCASVRFHSKGGEPLLAVGTVTGMTMQPMKQTVSHIVLYRIINGDRFQLLHRTTVEDGPVLSLAHFQGRLIVGIGRSLRLYEMGKRQLLRKCELRGLPTVVKTIQTVGDRAYVGDLLRSVQIVRYDAPANRLVSIARDASPRPIVAQELLDWNTVAVSDKFGNVSVLRLPKGANAGTMDLTGQRALWESSRVEVPPKLDVLCQYWVGEVVTSMTRSSLVAGGPESLIYVTVSGRIGALVPFTSRDQVEFYSQLESALRTSAPRPTGRDPFSFRSYYAPVMHVIDGDLCDCFNTLPYDEQKRVAEELELTVGEVIKKLEDTRNSLL